ncbi:MAG: glutamyl-tRNA reductase [Sulfurovaceae bacterium]|nr:glutamyl-tRNA reductase [Sulfurovaceae bacterium]
MYYQIISFNYKNCDLGNREKISFKTEEDKKEMLTRLVGFDFIHEAFIVSTCNRTEIVTANKDNFSTYHTILGIMSEYSGVNFHELKEMMERFDDEDAVGHIFSVVSSLDSLVVGESQITGQVKDAFRFSYNNATAGKKLNRLLSYAVKCAAEVRNETQISANPISIASVAVSQAEEILQDTMAGMTAIVIGTGEMGILTTKHLLRSGCDVILLGRDINKANDAAQNLGDNIKVDTIENLEKYINRYRLLFSATSSPVPVVTKDLISECDFRRLWFDIAIPRDIEETEDEKITIYRIDDLQHISNINHALRQEQALKASEIVSQYQQDFYRWLKALSIEPVIKGIREHVNAAIEKELSKAIKKGFVPKELHDNLHKLAVSMFNQFLHKPTKKMRQSSKEKEGVYQIEAMQCIFDVNTEDVDPKQYKEQQHTKGYKA